jgi:hypothetical protein
MIDIKLNLRVQLVGAANGSEAGETKSLEVVPGEPYEVTTTAPVGVIDGPSEGVTSAAVALVPETPRRLVFSSQTASLAALTHAPATVWLSPVSR